MDRVTYHEQTATVILAMGAGKAAAKGIDEFIKNKAK